ncbi:helix-turn-helix domain-containing protein [Candidatus Woesearchaeota archaeon]|nr:helix-turn-helix domain-containing protein [Candidatus Woesearchaeota archaeon]
MKKAFLHPQEIEVFYVLPSLRKYLALALKSRGMKQKDIAVILGITPATISQYASAKRADHIRFTPEVLAQIQASAEKVKDRLSYLRETQHLLHFIRSSKALCQIHKLFSEVPDACDPLHVGCHRVSTPQIQKSVLIPPHIEKSSLIHLSSTS